MSQNDNLVWMDLEMTGLDPERDVIIEMATIITDSDLNVIAEGPVIAVHQPDIVLDAMDDWNTKTHGQSGLIDRVKASTVDARAAEQMTLAFIQQHVKAGVSPLCGNSIHQDRRFLVKYMPQLEAYMHYRNIDVSTLKELAKRWKPDVVSSFKKSGSHQALDDIRESIAETLHYKAHFLAV
ncbi:MAG: oligoribonuclease [Bacterioplanes sp.]|nr:oligoribonuclease [Bacterioplanes sp.]